jgi:ketosteroid isomerase-like protein
MDEKTMLKLTDAFLGAWNVQDVEQVLACYTPDVLYRDPNTRGHVQGAEALRRYLTKLFGAWDMHWSLREAYLLNGSNGGAILWHASLKKAGGAKTVEVDGMDLVLLEGNLIKRNDVYFDRAALATLL